MPLARAVHPADWADERGTPKSAPHGAVNGAASSAVGQESRLMPTAER